LLEPTVQVNPIVVAVLREMTSYTLNGASGTVRITAPLPETDVSESP